MQLSFIANANLKHTWRWIQPLIARGHSVELISYTPVRQRENGLRIIDLTRLNNTPKLRFLFWAIWLNRYLKSSKPDLLHAHQVQAAGWLGWLSGYHPFVVTTWGSDLLQEPLKSPYRRWLISQVLSHCDQLIAPSHILEKAALDLGMPEKRITRIPWGVDTTIFSPQSTSRTATRRQLGLQPDHEVIFCPRSLTPLYHIDAIIQAVGLIAEQRPQVRLILLEFNPDVEYSHRLKEYAAEIGLQGKLIWLPPLDQDHELANLYRAADIMVSIPESEGFGLSVYEALACGCPAIISDLPVFSEQLIDNHHVVKVPTGQVEALADALVTILENPALRDRLAKQGQTLAENYSSQRIVDRAEILYANLISESR